MNNYQSTSCIQHYFGCDCLEPMKVNTIKFTKIVWVLTEHTARKRLVPVVGKENNQCYTFKIPWLEIVLYLRSLRDVIFQQGYERNTCCLSCLEHLDTNHVRLLLWPICLPDLQSDWVTTIA
ncbi:hypothetical protein TNCV_2873621 [Trichonephila clavipes]|nr:hypothetical protein TNCV_2873621 [Trichonephila clavipes]